MNAPFDVIVLGYGPVGAVLANLLGRDGLSVAVVDRMLDIYDKPRAINIDHEVMRLLQAVGLADAVEPITSHHTGTNFLGLNDRLIKVFHPVQPPYRLGWAPNLMFIQPEFEPILRDGVTRFANVEVSLGSEAVALEQDTDLVRLTVRNGAETRVIAGRYLVACDGAASPTRGRLGISQESLDFDEWWTVVDAWLKDPADLPERTTQFCRPSGPTTYVVGPRGLRRWEMKLLPHETPADYEDMAVVRRRMAPFVEPDAIDIWRVATYRFHALVAHQWQRGRVFLAGDAAHQMPPFMAQGLCAGVRDAGNLAWKLTGVLRDGLADRLLDSYEDERKPHIRELVATTKALGLIIGELDPDAAQRRDQILGRDVDDGMSETVRQKLVPDLTAGILALGSDGRPTPPAGSLSPQPWIKIGSTGRICRLDDVVGPRFLLLTLGAEAQEWLSEAAAAAWVRMGGARIIVASPGTQSVAGADVVSEDGTMLQDWMDEMGCRALVVRPDKYVYGGTSNRDDLNRQILQVDAALSRLLPAAEMIGQTKSAR